jgi:hypothetical protein
MSKKKRLAVEIVSEECLLYGGEWKSRKAIYEELRASGYERKDVDWYLFCLGQHQLKEERLKSLHVTASTGDPITLCPKCHEVREETAAFFKVPAYPAGSENDQGKTVQPEIIDVPFRPLYYCQCERIETETEGQPAPISGLIEGRLCHYVKLNGKHEACVIIEIFDASSGRVKLRNLYNLTLVTATYSQDTAIPDSWHWIEQV